MDIELSRGFVAFPRGLTEWEWYTEPNTARLYFHLLLTANWQQKQWQGITIQPGQLVTSLAHLSSQLGLTVHKVRTALEHLQSSGYVAISSGTKCSVITLINYDSITQCGKRDGKQTANERQADGKQPATTLPSIPSEPFQPSTTSPAGPETPPLFPELLQEYEANIGRLPPHCRTELQGYVQQLGTEVVLAVLHKCADLGGHSWAYVRKALEDAVQLDCHTAEAYRQRAPIGGSRAKGTRVDRADPPASGGDWLRDYSLQKSLARLQKKKETAAC